jgi:hypothetical protein
MHGSEKDREADKDFLVYKDSFVTGGLRYNKNL